jgi:hypothetical protein
MSPERRNILVGVVAIATIMVIGTRPDAERAGDPREKKLAEAAEQSARAAKAFEAIMDIPDMPIPTASWRVPKRSRCSRASSRSRSRLAEKAARCRQPPHRRWLGQPGVPPRGRRELGRADWRLLHGLLLAPHERRVVEGLMKDRFELGGEAAVAAGPVGRNGVSRISSSLDGADQDTTAGAPDRARSRRTEC